MYMEEGQVNNQETFLKNLVRNEEDRYISYKKMLEETFKFKDAFPVGDELSEWYKNLLREEKNISESRLKKLREELTDYRQGLNPSFLYNVRKRKVQVDGLLDVIKTKEDAEKFMSELNRITKS